MPRKVKVNTNTSSQSGRKALSPEARENQLINLAVDLAEQQLRNGTASSQVITHYLKLGSTKERLEKELMQTQQKFVEAKTESIQTTRHDTEKLERLFQEAIDAQRIYAGEEVEEDE